MILIPSVKADGQTFKPIFKPEITITKTSETITIDGEMTESIWSTASKVNNFSERYPGDLTKPTVETEVYLTYDDKNLYLFFKCFDDPNSIRATKSQRDQFSGNDMVTVTIDTYGDASLAYEFFVNPYGIQQDMLWSAVSDEEDISVDMVWESAAQITSEGYQVEISIPFTSVRYTSQEVQEWRIDFGRIRPRESEFKYNWAARDRNNPCWVCQLGILKGIQKIHQKRNIELLPTFVGYQSGHLNNFDNPLEGFYNEKIDGELSMSGKYTISSGVVLESAVNPDYSQIESDATQIDVNSATSLYYPERRPYFQEGSDLFSTIWGTFYTRTIDDPQFTAKVTARSDNKSIAFLTAVDENSPYMIPLELTNYMAYPGKSLVNVLRGKHTFGGKSQVGFMYTDRRFDVGGYNLLYSADGVVYLSERLKTRFQLIGTKTKEPNDTLLTSHVGDLIFDKGEKTAAFDGESYGGGAYVGNLDYKSRNLSVYTSYERVDPSYRTVTGFDTRNNYHSAYFNTSYKFYPQHSILEKIDLSNGYYHRWNLDNKTIDQTFQPRLRLYFRYAQIYIAMGVNRVKEKWMDNYYNSLTEVFLIQSSPSDKFSIYFIIDRGEDIARYVKNESGGLGVKSNRVSMNIAFDLKPIDKLTINSEFNYLQHSNPESDEKFFKGYISRTKIEYQANKELSLRLVAQYNNFSNSWDIDPLLTYRLNSFTVCYIGSTYDYNQYETGSENIKDWAMSSRQYFMKIQYLVQL